MGMNLNTMLFLQEFGVLTHEKNKILDIGPQNVYFATEEQIRRFVDFQGKSVGDETLEGEIKRLVYFSTPRPEERTTLFSEITDLTNIEYNSFDVCPGLKTELLDLNYESCPTRYKECYDVVLNFGTTEHIFNQFNCFEVIHDATKVDGIIYHQLPATGYLDHGYFTYTPVFFRDLAISNDYEILDTFFMPAGRNDPAELGIDVRDGSRISFPRSGAISVFDRRVPCYDVHVLIRKRRSGRFRCALEIATAHAAVDQAMTLRYAAEEELRDRLLAAAAERDALRVELTERDNSLGLLKDEVEVLQGSLRHSEARYEAVVSSTSWRITTPLRNIVDKLRNNKR